MTVSLEIGHHYADDRADLARQLRLEMERMPGTFDTSVGVFIDDYNAPLPHSRDESIAFVRGIAKGVGLMLDFVQFEADGAPVAHELLDRAASRLDISVDGRRLTRNTRAEQSSVLVAETQRLCCPTLAATWVLARLGVSPYVEAYQGVGEFTGNRAVTVLPTRYLRGEATVMELIAAAGYRKQIRRVGYVFY